METRYSEHPAMFRNNPLGFVGALLLVPLIVGLVILLVWWLKCISIRLSFVGNDLVLEKGLLSKDRTELNVDSIRTVNVYQSFFNRLFDVGKISIFTAGDEPEMEVAGLPRPNELRELIKKHQAD
ncbi:MAG: membrane protein [Gammaproteobacteria bacterium BRH_c0]|nr:MAG: membrane protein [Gammaproteobacteria bacterium BRH_c0]